MTRVKLTEIDVLRAVVSGIRPRSNYINDEVQRWHARNVAKGATGHPPSVSLVLRRLKSLAAKGLLSQSAYTDGYYGYEWTITAKGNDALVRANAIQAWHEMFKGVRVTTTREPWSDVP